MIVNSKSDLAFWVLRLKEDPDVMLAVLGEKIAQGCDLFTARQLLFAYDPDRRMKVTEPGMGRALASAQIRQLNKGQQVRTSIGRVRLYAIRNVARWQAASEAELIKHYNKFFGPTSL